MSAITNTLLTLLLACCGCSSFIASSGKDLNKTIGHNATRTSIHAKLGEPARTQRFASPRSSSSFGFPESIHLPDVMLAGYEDYKIFTKVADPEEAQAMISGTFMSAGIFEPFVVPFMLYDAAKQKSEGNTVRIFYRPDDTYFAHILYGREKPPD